MVEVWIYAWLMTVQEKNMKTVYETTSIISYSALGLDIW